MKTLRQVKLHAAEPMDEALSIIGSAYRRNRIVEAVICFIAFAGGIGLALYGLWNENPAAVVFFMILGLALVIAALYGAVHVFHSGRKITLINVLKANPEQIVWVYEYITVNMPYGVKLFKMVTFHFHLLNRREYTIHVSAKKAPRLLQALKNTLSHATFGYSAEKEQLYRAEPKMLLKI